MEKKPGVVSEKEKKLTKATVYVMSLVVQDLRNSAQVEVFTRLSK